MSLDRQSIEKRDFPIGRRGYDPDAVDAHLDFIAAEVEELKLSLHRRTESVATSASEQVRGIVEAAESTAAQIQTEAEAAARAVRAEANADAAKSREEAVAQAREYVASVSAATALMLERLAAMETELGSQIEVLRDGAGRITADLEMLQGTFDDVRLAIAPAAAAAAAELASATAGAGPARPAPAPTAASPVDRIVEEFEGDPPAADQSEDARLVALSMALDGTPREQTEKYLAENFEVGDSAALLDEVYSSVDG